MRMIKELRADRTAWLFLGLVVLGLWAMMHRMGL